MGNRAYITLNNEIHYVHWNGGLDTICPLLEAIQTLKLDKKGVPNNQEIRDAFFKFCDSKMELAKDANRNVIEENGHYYFANDFSSVVHRFEKHNKKTDCYDVLSDIIKTPYDYFLTQFIPSIKENYRDAAITEYPERVQIFLEAFKELMAPRLEIEKAKAAQMAEDAKKPFKTLIKEDLKREFPSILPKLKSVKSSTYSGGSSLSVTCSELTEDEKAYMKKLMEEYEYGRFNGYNDCYEYKAIETKARMVSYANLHIESDSKAAV